MQRRFIHAVDAKWLARWAAEGAPRPRAPTLGPYYQLPMFPYPSGRLHIGHLRVYTISDALARFRRMRGFDVVHPHGWDAFGLPAENAAIEHGVDAREWTLDHIAAMRAQIGRMLVDFDLDREIVTCNADYYAHTQRLFLLLYARGLAYRKRATVNWDPVDKTVLANEQIDHEGRSWRSGAIAEQRELEQWFLRITSLSHELDGDLALLKDWPEEVKKMQRQWIGLSKGYEIEFGEGLVCFTTRIDTIYGVRFVAVAETHPLAAAHRASTRPNGLIEGLDVLHPLTREPLPVYVADYVVPGYGTEAVMGVPSRDERDCAFWATRGGRADGRAAADPVPLADQLPDLAAVADPAAVAEIVRRLGPRARPVTKTRLRDWLVSRQRFWGAPIPMVHCGECGVVPVPEHELPVELPSESMPLAANAEWLHTQCPQCGGPARRDTDTMDTFMDSSWYYFRYLDPHNAEEPFSRRKVDGLVPVDCYVGGIEHAILHLLYARFIAKALHGAQKWDGSALNGEPFRKLVTQGMVHGITHKDRLTKRYLKPDEAAAALAADPAGVEVSMEKMSKSKHNGVDPLAVIDKHGADATRAHMLFQAPVQDTLVWDTAKIVGVERWLAKVRALAAGSTPTTQSGTTPTGAGDAGALSGDAAQQWNEACVLLDSITASFEHVASLNTVVSNYMKLTKTVAALRRSGCPAAAARVLEALLRAMAPCCPASAEEFWELHLRASGRPWTSVHAEEWPALEPVQVSSEREFKVIVNSRRVGVVRAPADAPVEEVLRLANIAGAGSARRVVFKPQIGLLSVTV